MSKIELKTKRKAWIKKQDWVIKLLIYFAVFKVWFTVDAHKRIYRCEKFNLWNPLTIIMVIVFWIIYLIKYLFYTSFKDVVTSGDFRTKKFFEGWNKEI